MRTSPVPNLAYLILARKNDSVDYIYIHIYTYIYI